MKNKILLGLIILSVFLIFGCTRIGQGSTPRDSSGSIDLNACLAKSFCTGTSAIVRMGCKVDCYSKKALETKQPETCNPLKDDPDTGISAYTVCLQDLGKDVRSAEPCKRLSQYPVQYNACVSNIARKIRDSTLCSSIVEAPGYLGEKESCARPLD